MSSNSFILKGTDGGVGNGYWTNEGTSVGTLTLANGINFRFETFANYPKLVRVSLTGTYTLSTSGAGQVGINCTIPLSALPSWARPARAVPPATAFNSSVGGGFAIDYPSAADLIYFNCNISSDATNMLITCRATATAAVGALVANVSTLCTYIST